MTGKGPLGLWVMVVLGVALLAMLLLGQTMSFIDYGFTVSLGLQEPASEVTPIGVAMNKGFGVGDTIIYIPLLVAGLVGLMMRRVWGVFAMIAVMGITAYWPVVCLSFLFFAKGSPGFNFQSYTNYTLLLLGISFYGVWGMWYLCTRRQALTSP